jgi:hypothetical protein
VLVSHTHWDREWYRTFEEFRGRLVDAVDRVLDLVASDPGYRFVLDGQSIVVEDYLAIRPERRAELTRAIGDGRVSVGPWYVQPDSLIPSGETHVRNLLEGRWVASELGGVSTVAYTPDSFGHPAQFPQIFAGFGFDAFVYWRGNGSEIDTLGPTYFWRAPGGVGLPALQLVKGYFGASALPPDVDEAVARLEALGDALASDDGDAVLFMNGVDHVLPDPHTSAVCARLASTTGWLVEPGFLEDHVRAALDDRALPTFTGELIGARVTIVLPGVWSARTYLKQRNRRAESALINWAEPWVALGRRWSTPDERPALRVAWRALLANQAHDSICGCSIDAVHEQMLSRYDTAQGLAAATTARVLERLAGLGAERRTPWTESFDVAVWNASPHPRTDVVRIAVDGYPPVRQAGDAAELHPAVLAGIIRRGFTVDGVPARIVEPEPGTQFQAITQSAPVELEVVVADVPAFGWRKVRVAPADDGAVGADAVDDGRTITAGAVSVSVAPDGTLDVVIGDRTWPGLAGIEDCGDRGDSYDADIIGPAISAPESVTVERRRHPNGIEHLRVERVFALPAHLDATREARSEHTARYTVVTEARVAPGVARVDLRVMVDNVVDDHRLRLVFASGGATTTFQAATTFDIATRTTERPDDTKWVQPAVTTFPHQGWVAANGLLVGAPGLPEGEVCADGTIAITLLRSIGWLSRGDLRSRRDQAGPAMPAPGAQCPGRFVADLMVASDAELGAALDAEIGLRAVVAGPDPLVADGVPLFELAPRSLVLSTIKPAADGDGFVVRVLNPTDQTLRAELRLAMTPQSVTAVRLDESPPPAESSDDDVDVEGGTVIFAVPPHALRSVLLV